MTRTPLQPEQISIFASLFHGSDNAHYIRAADGRYTAVDAGITEADWERHLSGIHPSILSIPIDADGNSRFGVLDVDRHLDTDVSVDHAAIATRITELSLPLVLFRSKNGKGAWIVLFLKEKAGYPAITVQRLLEKYKTVLGLTGEVEVFPKNEELKPGQKGSGINIGYFGAERIAYGKHGEVLDLAGFISLAQERQVYGQVLESRDLVADSREKGPEPKEEHAMYAATAQKLHSDNLVLLHKSNEAGHWNDTLNTTAYFAARAFAAGALADTEDDVKDAIRKAASAITGYNQRQMEATLTSGWGSGTKQPLHILEDEFPERAATLKEFNEQFYIVENLGGKCRVCWEEIDETTGTLYLGHQSFEDFRNAHMHEQILTGEAEHSSGRGKNRVTATRPEYMSKANFWLDSPDRQQYRKVVYAPKEELGPKIRNLWRGFAVAPKQGNCSLYLDHVLENICKGNQDKFNWLIKWMAWKIRNPGLKSYTCPVFKGAEGIGKNMCADPFAFLWGCHAFAVTKKEHVTGHFNAHLRACSVLIANEAFFAGDKGQESTLKSLITDDSYMLEAKGIDAVPARNRLSIIVISNENWVVPAGPTARRFSVFDCGDAHKEDFGYFGNIQVQLSGRYDGRSGYKALLHYLLNEVNLVDFEPHQIIRTDALAEQQSQSLRGADALWYECLYRGELPGALKGNFLQSERLLKWGQLQKQRKYEGITAEQLALVLGENKVGVYRGMGFKHAQPRPIVNKVQVRAWAIPSLREARAMWDNKRFAVAWPDTEPLQSTNSLIESERDPDDWIVVAVGDEEKTVRHEVVTGQDAQGKSDADEKPPF